MKTLELLTARSSIEEVTITIYLYIQCTETDTHHTTQCTSTTQQRCTTSLAHAPHPIHDVLSCDLQRTSKKMKTRIIIIMVNAVLLHDSLPAVDSTD